MPSLAEILGLAGSIPYWVSGTNYQQGKTVRSPTDHQLYVRIVAGAGATDPASDSTNWRPDGGRAIKSIQRGVTTPGATGVISVTISPVNMAKARVSLLSSRAKNFGNTYDTLTQVRLASSTTLEVTGYTVTDSANQPNPVSWELIEDY